MGGSYPLNGTLYIDFDDNAAGNSRKNNRLLEELRTCVPIKVVVNTFTLHQQQKSVIVQRKRFPGVLGHAITIHKSQGGTYEYMIIMVT